MSFVYTNILNDNKENIQITIWWSMIFSATNMMFWVWSTITTNSKDGHHGQKTHFWTISTFTFGQREKTLQKLIKTLVRENLKHNNREFIRNGNDWYMFWMTWLSWQLKWFPQYLGWKFFCWVWIDWYMFWMTWLSWQLKWFPQYLGWKFFCWVWI